MLVLALVVVLQLPLLLLLLLLVLLHRDDINESLLLTLLVRLVERVKEWRLAGGCSTGKG